ncbi:ABC transporter permease [Mucilaginibacter psychrotolerans]|uniref:ABC transporter permease n=1 Tax=Mucilaginibacter psychrotolerans TaxID=1524096 RepID=A0A4Y8SLY1_9SPHI|nr:ABC transporter permease [Mucilaginibacter psychrotolerans]TFF39670.1 ABC transporter permease [Mucilaginibacter psychrotolerans]
MIKSYLKIAWRGIANNKTSFIINVGGLAMGMAVSFMLLLYVYNEYNFDKFHANGERLYQVFKNQPSNGEIRTKTFTQQLLAGVLKNDFPEVENVARINESKDALISFKDKGLKANTIAADPALFDLFTFQFVWGDRQTALADPAGIILSEATALAVFGNRNPVGEMVQYENQFPMKVSAVIKDNPQNSSFTFKAIIPWEAFLSQNPWLKGEGWDNYAYFTYVRLRPGVSPDVVNAKIRNLIGQHFPKDEEVKLFIFPFTKLHLYGEFKNGVNTGGSIEYVRLFLFLAIGILLIACINFMNLSTARSERRAREVGIRKAIGARRGALIKQFMGESLLMAFVAFLLSLVLIIALLPVFNNLININLDLPYTNPIAWCIALAATVITGVVAGCYPALFLSSFNPVKVLKGQTISTGSTINPRRVLVVIQFTFATCLIIFSTFVYRQIGFIKNRPVGYKRDGMVEIAADGRMYDQFDLFRRDALASGAITDAALISDPITNVTGATWNNTWPGQLPGESSISIDCLAATYHFIDTYQLNLLEGRDFATDRPADSTAVILNQAAVKLMRLKEPIGQQITWMGGKRTVIGVVKNFVLASPYEPVKPVIIGFMKGWATSIGLRLNPTMPVSRSLAILQRVYKKYNPSYPFEYKFTDESFSIKFRNEKLLGTMAVLFTCLAIMLSALGLFGLAAFSAERRRKEISIRKVLGAGTGALWLKLSQEFVVLVLISSIIGSLISWYNISRWLSKYTYHASISVWVFVATLVLSMVICLAVVSYQSIKAALANPVKALRSE